MNSYADLANDETIQMIETSVRNDSWTEPVTKCGLGGLKNRDRSRNRIIKVNLITARLKSRRYSPLLVYC